MELEQAINEELQTISAEAIDFALRGDFLRLELFMRLIEGMISIDYKPEYSNLAQQIVESIYLKMRLHPDRKEITKTLSMLMGMKTSEYWKSIRRAG